MSRRRGTASLVASPVLVGAVTVLITIIAVFIAYNANKGLPFVPTYDLKAQLPSGAKLVKGNEVRVGGFRVGVVDDLKPATVNGKSVALVSLKLDKTVEPLAKDTRIRVRPRSALGLKYVELTPGHSSSTYAAGDTIPLKYASEPLELENVLEMFDRPTRPRIRRATQGFGDAFAGRGTSLNTAIEALNPFFRYLTPVMTNLAAPSTRLDNFFRQLERTTAQVAPVAHTQALLFTHMANTFEALSRHPRELQETIAKSPSTLDASIASLPVQRVFFADAAVLSAKLRPAAVQLQRSLPIINRALGVGIPILRRQPELNRRLEGLNRAALHLFRNPNTLLALKDLRTALSVTRPAIEFIAPYQTVCSYANYFLLALGDHQSQSVYPLLGTAEPLGTIQVQGIKLANTTQANNYGTTQSSRPVDIPPNENPIGSTKQRLYAQPYQPAIDAKGNADCQIGQEGYIRGPLVDGFERYGRGTLPDGTPTGGNWAVVRPDTPGLRGGTYVSRRNGITSERDVP